MGNCCKKLETDENNQNQQNQRNAKRNAKRNISMDKRRMESVKKNNDKINMEKKLMDVNPAITPFFSFEGMTVSARVVDVYDGDTCTLLFKYNDKYYKFKLRMYGYDTPELKPRKTTPNRDMIIMKARVARDALKNAVQNRIVRAEFTGKDKYGRLLGTLYYKDCNINKWMVTSGQGIPYFGGKKK